MFLPIAFNPNLDHIRYHVETNKPSTVRNPYTQDMLRTGRLSFENYLEKIPDPAFGRDPEPDYTPEPNNPSPKPYKPAAVGLTPAKVKEIDYINADLAKYYGMSKSTAYQEALLNTAYQREVQDMKAAGLNPAVLYSAGRASGADTSLYPSEKRSGGGSRRRYGGSSGNNAKLFSSSAYAAIQAIGGLIGLGATKRPDGFWIGSQTAKGAMGLLDAISKK